MNTLKKLKMAEETIFWPTIASFGQIGLIIEKFTNPGIG